MGLFDSLKKMLNQSSDIFNIRWHIEDWQPNIKIPKYDRLFSLQKFLEREHVHTATIQKVMSSKNPFGEAKNLYIGTLNNKLNLNTIYSDTSQRLRKWTIVWTLRDAEPCITFENVFMYILYQIAAMFDWNIQQSKSLYIDGMKRFLANCTNNEYRYILSSFDGEVLSCFALAHKKSGMQLMEILSYGFNYLEMNCKRANSPHGNFFNVFGKENIKGLIYKVFESAYTINKFSLGKLFLMPEKFVDVETSSMKYDIMTMQRDGEAYLPKFEHKQKIVEDVLSLNGFLKQAKILAKGFPNVIIENSSVMFYSATSNPDIREYCCFFYKPNTATGRASKYPLTLMFYTNKGIFGDIEYLQNKNIGKVRIVVWNRGKCFVISCIDKKRGLAISKIEETKQNGITEILYNINVKQ